MTEELYVIFNARGVDRVIKSTPKNLARGEYFAVVTFTVPQEFFAARPVPRAEIVIPAPFINEPGVSIDPARVEGAIDDKSAQLSMALSLFGQMLEKGRESGDDSIKELAEQSFAQLMAWGIDVRLVDAGKDEVA